MRLFAALPLPPSTVQALAALQSGWREAGWPLRWATPSSLHVTVRFFGDVAPDVAGPLGSMLDEAARGTGPVTLEPVAVRPFPGGTRARLVWLELAAEPALELLAHRVELGATALGLAPARDTFRPHVTLARVERSARLPREAGPRLAAASLPATFSVEELHLMQSHLGAGAPRYEARHVSALAA